VTRPPAIPVAALALLCAPAALAAPHTLVERTFTEPPRPGLAVTGALSHYVVTSRARVMAPGQWKRHAARAGRLRFTATQNPGCHYDLTYRIESVLAAPGSASDFVAGRLVPVGARYLLDGGQRGNTAFRVVRRKSVAGRVRVDALWAGVLTRRADIAPAGKWAWSEIHVTARSRSGDECHSGTWRQSLGPAIGDSLAVARTTLRFSRRS
jgi:hypothetical protein